MTMIRSSSPAMSEISVGSPSPPPPPPPQPQKAVQQLDNISKPMGTVKCVPFVPVIKRLKPIGDFSIALPQRQKSSNERVKSFSIADILGKNEEISKEPKTQHCETLSSSVAVGPSIMAVPPLLHNIPTAHGQMSLGTTGPLLMLDLPALHKVMPAAYGGDPAAHLSVHPAASTSSPALPIHPFFPPALLHYEQRLAWDYQRQLQEHFQAQAQLLRQMSMDPNIIPSEDGSERAASRNSSSAGSQIGAGSPELHVESDNDDDMDENDDDATIGAPSNEATTIAHRRLNGNSSKIASDTPLDALFQLSTKNFDEDQDPATLNIFATRPNPKKKRKSRTAFTNHQIFELEKRFLYQKYLSPADRDEIAAGLGLSNAQVITWFQNRRAKLKRDMEELKKDVESVKQLSAHKSFLENVNDLSILKTRPVSRHHHPPTHAEVIHTPAAITHGMPGTSTGPTAAAAAATATATGRPLNLQHQPRTIQQPISPNKHHRHHQHHHHQHHPSHAITISTCNETGDRPHIISTTAISAQDSISQINSSRPTPSQSPQSQDNIIAQASSHNQQPARNLQISTSRG